MCKALQEARSRRLDDHRADESGEHLPLLYDDAALVLADSNSGSITSTMLQPSLVLKMMTGIIIFPHIR